MYDLHTNQFIIQMRIKLVLIKMKKNKYIYLKYSTLIFKSFRFNYQKYNLNLILFKADNRFTIYGLYAYFVIKKMYIQNITVSVIEQCYNKTQHCVFVK